MTDPSPPDIDPEKLLADLEEREAEAKELVKETQDAPDVSPEDGERLIKTVAENLATMHEAAGLPKKSVGYFEDQIRSRQR